MRKTIRVARRVVGNCHHCTLTMRCIYAEALYKNAGATPDDHRDSSDGEYKLVTTTKAPATYAFGKLDDDKCPSGYKPLTTSADCDQCYL